LQFESRLSDWNSIPLRQAPQLLQGEPAAAAGLGDQNARPNALRTWITQACLCTHRRQPIGGPPSSIPSRRSASPGGTNAVNALKRARRRSHVGRTLATRLSSRPSRTTRWRRWS